MLQIDFDKAFDPVKHNVLFDILERANVGSLILKGARMAYKDCTTRLIVNKELTDVMNIRSSVRQGCPLSPLFFNLYLELFCLNVLNGEQCSRFRLGNVEVKVMSYADDVAVFCSDKRSVSAAVTLANRYCEATGAAVNWSMCRGFLTRDVGHDAFGVRRCGVRQRAVHIPWRASQLLPGEQTILVGRRHRPRQARFLLEEA